MFISKPKVKDLLAFLAGCDPEALVLISDSHGGVNQLDTTVGFIEIDAAGRVGGNGYVETKEGRDEIDAETPGTLWAPAVQLDTGT